MATQDGDLMPDGQQLEGRRRFSRRCRITLGLRMSADQEDGHQQAGQSVDGREEHDQARRPRL